MKTHAEHPLARCFTIRVMAGAAALAAALVACGGGGDTATPVAPPVAVTPPPVVVTTAFTQTALVSDGSGAAHTDPNLVNAWGIAFNPTGFV